MKILMTGFMNRQCKTPERAKSLTQDYVVVCHCLYKALLELGHDVDIRKVKPLEDLSGYDLCVLGLYAPHANAAITQRFGALWAASQLPHVTYFEDWNVRLAMEGLSKPESSAWSMPDAPDDPDAMIKIDELHAACRSLSMMRHAMIFAYPWAKTSELTRNHARRLTHPHGWNPTPWAMEVLGPAMEAPAAVNDYDRQRRWIALSLSPVHDWLRRQGCTWPVFGSVGGDVPFISEQEIIRKHCSENWGMLLPSHWGGCKMPGFWRPRWLYAPARRCVLAVDKREAEGLDPDAWPSVAEIEAMSDAQLTEVSQKQLNAVSAAYEPKSKILMDLKRILDEARIPAAAPR